MARAKMALMIASVSGEQTEPKQTLLDAPTDRRRRHPGT